MISTAILCVDDEEVVTNTLRTLLVQNLKEVTIVEVATSAEEALEIINEFKNDGIELLAVISDYIMPIIRGDELLVKIHQTLPKIKKIMLTGQSDISGVTRVINEADLYRFIEKPWNNEDLLLTISGAITAYKTELELERQHALLQEINEELEEKIAERTRELEEKNIELQRLSNTDQLTGLYNRLKLDTCFSSELSRAGRTEIPFSVAIIDIDNFKLVNDQYGHLVGDTILIEFANLLKNRVRVTDIVGRWGGEEFLIILSATDLSGACQFAEQTRRSVENNNFTDVGRVTASFGVSAYQNGDTIKSLVHRADQALYQAKNNGRNQVEKL